MITALIALLLVGIVFLTLEIFLPGGVLGVLAVICFGAAVFIGFKIGTNTGLGTLAGVFGIGALYLMFFTIVLPKSKLGQRFALNTNIDEQVGAEADLLLHREGESVTDLRPGGIARIDGDRIDVVAVAGYVKAGTRVRVIEVDGSSVMVETIEAPKSSDTSTAGGSSEFPEF